MRYPEAIRLELRESANPDRAKHSYGFFKAIPGGYGEGDRFLGVTVPDQRRIARRHCKDISLRDVGRLLRDPFHECRLTALLILCLRFEKAAKAADKSGDSAGAKEQEEIVELYLKNIAFVNNWDLVDSSAPYILGRWLLPRDKKLLHELADSGDLWKQRIAIIATLHFIKHGRFKDTLALARKFLDHPHDLIHKATGWMLREIGNRDFDAEYRFMEKHYARMPRTMLRYAIEKFDPEVRRGFLQGKV